MSAFCLFF